MGVLHTNSKYARESIDFNFDKEKHKKSGIRRLEAQEKALYAKFGASTYEKFIETIRSLFNSKDRDVIRRFEANALQSSLRRFTVANNEIFEQNVQFVFNFDKISDKTMKLKFPDKSVGTVNLNYNVNEVKKTLNKYFSYHHFRGGNWTRELDDFIKLLMRSEVLTINVQDDTSGQYKEYVPVSKIPNFPWGVLKSDVEQAELLGEQSAIYSELQKALDRIESFIFNELGAGASDDLLNAMRKVWNHNMGPKKNNPVLFFSGGTKSNFISGVQGALGEFQTALIFEYLALKINNSAMAKIIGSSYANGEQLRTDVQIFNKLGIQVKNVTDIGNNQLLRDLKTTIHPSKVARYLDDGMGFQDFIANYYFNEDYQSQSAGQIEAVIKGLGDYLGEIMNLAVSRSVGDTVAFYMIGGKYLVPGSVILSMADELNLRDSIEITSSFKGNSDEGYMSKSGKDQPPLFVDYWKHYKSGWRPQEKNQETYSALVNHAISIRTHFNLFASIGNFSLF